MCVGVRVLCTSCEIRQRCRLLPLTAATSFEHRGPQCLLTLTRSTSPPLDQFPLRACMCPLCIINRLWNHTDIGLTDTGQGSPDGTSSPCQGRVRYVQAPSLCRLSLAERGQTPSGRGATAGADIAVTRLYRSLL